MDPKQRKANRSEEPPVQKVDGAVGHLREKAQSLERATGQSGGPPPNQVMLEIDNELRAERDPDPNDEQEEEELDNVIDGEEDGDHQDHNGDEPDATQRDGGHDNVMGHLRTETVEIGTGVGTGMAWALGMGMNRGIGLATGVDVAMSVRARGSMPVAMSLMRVDVGTGRGMTQAYTSTGAPRGRAETWARHRHGECFLRVADAPQGYRNPIFCRLLRKQT